MSIELNQEHVNDTAKLIIPSAYCAGDQSRPFVGRKSQDFA
jgi:hypothetical protein